MSIHLRVPPEEVASIDAWIERQDGDELSRPEAIRRLAQLGLTVSVPTAAKRAKGTK
jgi:hypothetical protein